MALLRGHKHFHQSGRGLGDEGSPNDLEREEFQVRPLDALMPRRPPTEPPVHTAAPTSAPSSVQVVSAAPEYQPPPNIIRVGEKTEAPQTGVNPALAVGVVVVISIATMIVMYCLFSKSGHGKWAKARRSFEWVTAPAEDGEPAVAIRVWKGEALDMLALTDLPARAPHASAVRKPEVSRHKKPLPPECAPPMLPKVKQSQKAEMPLEACTDLVPSPPRSPSKACVGLGVPSSPEGHTTPTQRPRARLSSSPAVRSSQPAPPPEWNTPPRQKLARPSSCPSYGRDRSASDVRNWASSSGASFKRDSAGDGPQNRPRASSAPRSGRPELLDATPPSLRRASSSMRPQSATDSRSSGSSRRTGPASVPCRPQSATDTRSGGRHLAHRFQQELRSTPQRPLSLRRPSALS